MNTTLTWEGAVEWLRAQPDRQDLVRHCYYDDPVEAAAERFRVSSEWQATEALLAGAPAGDVLDLGAGRGIASYAFARTGRRVFALEPDPSPVVGRGAIARLADRTGLPITLIAGVGEGLPFENDQFAIVYGRAVLHHAQDLPKLCREVARVLQPGGRFLAVREHVISRDNDLPIFLASHPLHCLYGGENAFRLDQYLAAFREAELEMRRVLGPFDNPVNYWPWSEADLRRQFSRRMPQGLRWLLQRFLAMPSVWSLVAPRLSRWSNAPGRHYAFLGVKQ